VGWEGLASRKIILHNWKGLSELVPDKFKQAMQEFIADADNRVLLLVGESTELRLNPQTLQQAKRTATRGSPGKVKLEQNKLIIEARKFVILLMLSHGYSVNQIGDELGRQRAYISNILDRMRIEHDCRTTTQLVCKALRAGYIR
jgi:DNA-binding NarL/FixJ family response regulator